MLDVARHFFDVSTVTDVISQVAMYKINRLHLHLTDDQGWRIEIDGWENLTDEGADSEVDGGEAGYFTVDDYEEINQHAQDHQMVVIPEIDMPGHTGAGLSPTPNSTVTTRNDRRTPVSTSATRQCVSTMSTGTRRWNSSKMSLQRSPA
jgi:N-acetyl-beta-hexosaminidase